jgi:hypothetical protein
MEKLRQGGEVRRREENQPTMISGGRKEQDSIINDKIYKQRKIGN